MYKRHKWTQMAAPYCLIFLLITELALGCSPGRGGFRRRGSRKMTPLVFKQHVPNISETTFGASGTPEGRMNRDDQRFQDLVVNYNPDIIFKDEEGTGADRIMTQRCKDKLNTLAIQVMNQWPGIKVRVTEGWDEDLHHAQDSLHYEGRALDITTSDRDRAKYGMLARLAVEAGFDWVYYENRGHIHVSVKSDTSIASNYGGCFPGSGLVQREDGSTVRMSQLRHGDRVLTLDSTGQLVYSEIILFFHKDDSSSGQFLKIETSHGKSLLITSNHLIHTSKVPMKDSQNLYLKVTPTFANNIKKGDYIYISDSSNGSIKAENVIDISVVKSRGMYAPLTKHGTIIVDNYVTSCYAHIDSHNIAHTCLAPMRLLYSIYRLFITEHLNSTHTTIGGRVMTSVNDNGVHWYADVLHSLAYYVIPHFLLFNT